MAAFTFWPSGKVIGIGMSWAIARSVQIPIPIALAPFPGVGYSEGEDSGFPSADKILSSGFRTPAVEMPRDFQAPNRRRSSGWYTGHLCQNRPSLHADVRAGRLRPDSSAGCFSRTKPPPTGLYIWGPMPATTACAVAERLEGFHRVRLHTLELIAPLSQQELDFVPAPGKWSVGEIVDHIILAADSLQHILEELVRLKRSGQRPFVRRTFADFDVSFAWLPKSLLPLLEVPFSLFSSFVPGRLRDFLIQNRLLPFRAAQAATPRHGLSAGELRNRLRTSFESVLSIFESNADLDFHEMAAQHPLFGCIRMTDLPELMASHELRHQKQIGDVLASRPATELSHDQ